MNDDIELIENNINLTKLDDDNKEKIKLLLLNIKQTFNKDINDNIYSYIIELYKNNNGENKNVLFKNKTIDNIPILNTLLEQLINFYYLIEKQ